MKRWTLYLGIITLLIPATIFAQTEIPKKDLVNSFLTSETKIVLEPNNQTYNNQIKEAIKKHWKISSYEFISTSEFKKSYTNPDYSFIVLTKTRISKEKANVYYDFLNVFMGDESATSVAELPELISIPFKYSRVLGSRHFYKLSPMAQFLQNHFKEIIKHRGMLVLRGLNYYHKHIPKIKNHELWISEKDLAETLPSLKDIREIYPYPLKIVSDKRLRSAIDEKKNIIFLHNIGPEDNEGPTGRCYKLLFNAQNGRMYYYKYHQISPEKPEGFLIKDFKRITGGKWF